MTLSETEIREIVRREMERTRAVLRERPKYDPTEATGGEYSDSTNEPTMICSPRIQVSTVSEALNPYSNQPKPDHVLRLRSGWSEHTGGYFTAWIECNVEPGAGPCSVTCSEGCGEWNLPDHEHPMMPVNYCNVREFLEADDMLWESFAGINDAALSDGMPVEVEWYGDGYVWRIDHC